MNWTERLAKVWNLGNAKLQTRSCGLQFAVYLTNKPEADGELILPPSLHQCSALRAFKDIYQATLKRRSRNKDLRSHQGIDLRISRTDGRALTNRANLCPCNSLLVLSGLSLLVLFIGHSAQYLLGPGSAVGERGEKRLKRSEPSGAQGALRLQIFAVSPRFLPSPPPPLLSLVPG